MRQRAGALYIKDGKLLLISEGGQHFFWTPGGGVENAESFEQALRRELEEELGATLLSAKLFLSFDDTAADEHVNYYLVDITYPETLPNGTRMHWYSATEYQANAVPVSRRVHTVVYPKLLADGLI